MIVPKLWGHEDILVNTPLYCLKKLYVQGNDTQSSIHFHKKKHETFYIGCGNLCIEIYEPIENATVKAVLLNKLSLSANESITIPALTPHRFYAQDGYSCSFLEVSTHDDPEDSYRIVPSGLRKVEA